MHKQTKLSGFTIVELLIVVVVIAILAAISVVAYRGIQERANDTAVQSDVNNFAKKIMLYKAEFDTYPAGNNTLAPIGIDNFSVARNSYTTSSTNFLYCTGTVSGSPVFAVGGASKSGSRYYYSSQTGSVQNYIGNWPTSNTAGVCEGLLPGVASLTRSYGFSYNTQTWGSWTQ